jgi:hypothetical protein
MRTFYELTEAEQEAAKSQVWMVLYGRIEREVELQTLSWNRRDWKMAGQQPPRFRWKRRLSMMRSRYTSGASHQAVTFGG